MKIIYRLIIIYITTLFFNVEVKAQTYNFNPDWRFIRENIKGAENPSFNDSSWKQVSAPHTYNDVDTFDDFHDEGHVGERDQWGGKTWYRKSFEAPKSWKNQQIIIEFEAVRQVAELYINGEYVGKGENGFVPFGFDLTSKIKIGSKNLIALRVDNEFIQDEKGKHKWSTFEGGARFPWINPHWHPAHGGIYRNVKLHILPAVHLTLPLYSSLQTTGTYTYAIDASRKQATIGVEPQIKNSGNKKVNLTVIASVIDMEGNEVLTINKDITLESGATAAPQLRGSLKSPELWEPKHPYVYKVITKVFDGKKLLHQGEEPLGVRWLKWNPYTGAYINDRYIKFQVWGHKPTDEWPGMGAAQPDWLRHFTLSYIPKAEGNFIRWGHCAGSPAEVAMGDKYGFVTLMPGVSGESQDEGETWDIRIKSFKDMIVY